MQDTVKFGTVESDFSGKPSSFLSAYYDPLASLNLFSQHLVLCDIHNTGEAKLIAANISNGLKGFQLKVRDRNFGPKRIVQKKSIFIRKIRKKFRISLKSE